LKSAVLSSTLDVVVVVVVVVTVVFVVIVFVVVVVLVALVVIVAVVCVIVVVDYRARNNGRSTINDRQEIVFDRRRGNLAVHLDRQEIYLTIV
jgi:hypothetical protein